MLIRESEALTRNEGLGGYIPDIPANTKSALITRTISVTTEAHQYRIMLRAEGLINKQSRLR